MKYSNCPNKDLCWGYDENNCDSCVIGEKLTKQARKNKRLETELDAMKFVAASLANELNMTDEEFNEEVKTARKKVKGEKK